MLRHKGVLFTIWLLMILLSGNSVAGSINEKSTTLVSQTNPVTTAVLNQAVSSETPATPSVARLEKRELESLEQIAQTFVGAKLKTIPAIIEKIQNHQEPAVLPLLQTLLDGELYYIKSNKQLVKAVQNKPEKTYALSDIFSGEAVQQSAVKKSIKKVKTSNKVRKQLRTAIAKLSLQSDSPATRLSSIKNMMSNINDDSLILLKDAAATEQNKKVKKKLSEAIALGELTSLDEPTQLAAINTLSDSLEPVVKTSLIKLLESGSVSPNVKAEAEAVLSKIEGKITFYGYLERIFFGLSLGSILLLVAAGLAITFGVMGVINMAHGELIMLGAYTTYVIQLLMPNHIALSILVAIPAAFLVSGFFGVLIERGVIQFLKGRPLETLLATFGISLILQQLVRTVFSPLNRQVTTPEFMSGAWQINPVFSLTYNRIYILIFALVVFVLLQLLMKRTALGLYVRAVSQNRNMARSMGIRSEWVDAMTFGLGSGVAGLAGVALSQITNVGPNLGQAYIIDSFMVVVFGGVGNLWGTLVGAFTIGALNKFLEPVTGTVLATIIVLVGIILFIQKKPRGLFPQKGRAAEA